MLQSYYYLKLDKLAIVSAGEIRRNLRELQQYTLRYNKYYL